MHDAVLLLTTVPSLEAGEQIGRALVGARLAACVNVLPPMVSIYRWQGVVHRDTEYQVVIKTRRSRIDEAHATIRDVHPYQLPEFLVLPLESGDPDYLAWVMSESSEPGA